MMIKYPIATAALAVLVKSAQADHHKWWIDWNNLKCVKECQGEVNAPPCGVDRPSYLKQYWTHDECCTMLYASRKGDDAAEAGVPDDFKCTHTDPDLRTAIERLITDSERELIPKYLRLGFHDCVGGCDGCVDLKNPDNNGLLEPIEEIAPIVEVFKNKYSRADVWAMATMVSAQMSLGKLDDDGNFVSEAPDGITFPLSHVGRKDCEGANAMGIGGPKVEMPSNDLDTHGLLDFFSDEFNFNASEAVAIMGAHSVAVASRTNVGFGNLGKEEGWVCHAEEYILNNRFYSMLVGEDGDLVNSAPNWTQEFVNNTEGIEFVDEETNETEALGPGIPNRYQWFNTDKCDDEERPIMTNADMALVRDFSNHISVDENGTPGKVNCTFKEDEGEGEDIRRRRGLRFGISAQNIPAACPIASETIDIVSDYKEDNEGFLHDFQSVLEKMVENGYEDEMGGTVLYPIDN